MKRILAWLLVAATLLSLCGCASASTPQETSEAPVETAATEATTAQTTPTAETQAATEETEAVVEGNLYLKVSSITLSLVGDSEDIYLGLVPRELVTWESDDPDIVSVENGVLTATGVGTTTIRATYEDRQAECTAGCLAATQEELDALDPAILSAPKRLPPEVDLEEACTYFDNAAIVGDSITYFLMQWESKTNYLGDLLFLARGGVSMNGFVRHFRNIYYRGKEMYLEDAIAASQVERVYFLMGSNDISAVTQRPYLLENWDIMLERIREKSPDVEIVLITNIPLYDEEPKSTLNDANIKAYNDLIEEYNENLKQIAEENDCLYLDLCYYVQDHYNRMPEIYNQGSYHMNEAGCLNWMKILRYYAQFESEGGTLS